MFAGLIMLGGAILLTIVSWYLIQDKLLEKENAVKHPMINEEVESSPVFADIDQADTLDESVVPVADLAPIKVSEVPLSPAQISAAEAVGIDVETFVITPAMQECAIDKIGQERVFDLIEGQAPSFKEGLTLIGCL